MKRMVICLVLGAFAMCLVVPAEAGQNNPTHPCFRILGDPYPGAGWDQLICGDDIQNIINGGVGEDRIYGRAGNDWLTGGRGRDRVFGGPGFDTCYVQPIDRVVGCERIR